LNFDLTVYYNLWKNELLALSLKTSRQKKSFLFLKRQFLKIRFSVFVAVLTYFDWKQGKWTIFPFPIFWSLLVVAVMWKLMKKFLTLNEGRQKPKSIGWPKKASLTKCLPSPKTSSHFRIFLCRHFSKVNFCNKFCIVNSFDSGLESLCFIFFDCAEINRICFFGFFEKLSTCLLTFLWWF
jgi:hypothetical protein